MRPGIFRSFSSRAGRCLFCFFGLFGGGFGGSLSGGFRRVVAHQGLSDKAANTHDGEDGDESDGDTLFHFFHHNLYPLALLKI
ncbi:hypothetical protein DN745_16885 [Bradymonas sediminis]|uniref:Uncharacterized protein n=1 Tax=Bradymonas sediminis TaxID=1548548 RepID=A0A2Z4FQH7_9DELT|nr:hypothetical protein DN745_16885 [Bradymonas sediminis]